MARTYEEIKAELTERFMAEETLANAYGFNVGASFSAEFSLVSVENMLFSIFAFSVWTLEKIFDRHKEEIDTALYEQKSGTLRWYRNKALAFQYGFALLEDSDKYDNGTHTDEEISASKIVKYCSVKETAQTNKLLIKIASDNNGVLTPITNGTPDPDDNQLEAFLSYMQEIKYAGVRIDVINNPADKLYLTMTVYRDPLVLDTNGNSLLEGGNPVEKAIVTYLQNLPFDGELLTNDFIAYLRQVPGVNNVNITAINYAWYNTVEGQYTEQISVGVGKIPHAGYFTIENFNGINYVV